MAIEAINGISCMPSHGRSSSLGDGNQMQSDAISCNQRPILTLNLGMGVMTPPGETRKMRLHAAYKLKFALYTEKCTNIARVRSSSHNIFLSSSMSASIRSFNHAEGSLEVIRGQKRP